MDQEAVHGVVFRSIMIIVAALLISFTNQEREDFVRDAIDRNMPTQDISALSQDFHISYDDAGFDQLAAGERAFFIPPYFAAEDGLLENFILMDLLSNGTVVYSFIADFSGDSAPELNTPLRYRGGVQSDGVSKGKVLVMMACNAAEELYELYCLEPVEDDMSFTTRTQIAGGQKIYAITYGTMTMTFPIKMVGTLPTMDTDKQLRFDYSAMSRDTGDLFFANHMSQIQEVHCLNASEMYFVLHLEKSGETVNVNETGYSGKKDNDYAIMDAARSKEYYNSHPVDSVSTIENTANNEEDEDDPDTFLLHYTEVELSVSFPWICESKYETGDRYTDIDEDDVSVWMKGGAKMDVEDVEFRYKSPLLEELLGIETKDMMVVEVEAPDESDMTAYFPITEWRDETFFLDEWEEVILKVPVFETGICYEYDEVEDGSYVALNGAHLSRFARKDEKDTSKTQFYQNAAKDKVTFEIEDGSIYRAFQLPFNSLPGQAGAAFVSNDALYICPYSTIKKAKCYRIKPDGGVLKSDPTLYTNYNIYPVNSNNIVLAGVDDGAVLCNLSANTRRCLWSWPCYAICGADDGSYWAIGFQPAEGSENAADFRLNEMIDARIYNVVVDDAKSGLTTFQKTLQGDPSRWPMLTESNVLTLWQQINPDVDYKPVKSELMNIVMAYRKFDLCRNELCSYLDGLRFLSPSERTSVDKELYGCRYWGTLSNLIRKIYETSSTNGRESSIERVAGNAVLKEGYAGTEEADWKKKKTDYEEFQKRVVAHLTGEELDGIDRIRAYDDWIKEIDSTIAAFQDALGDGRPVEKSESRAKMDGA